MNPPPVTFRATVRALYWAAILGVSCGITVAGCSKTLEVVNGGIVRKK